MIWQKMDIRTRLIVAYMSIILIGFAVIATIAGNQIASVARADFEEQFLGSSRLIAQGLQPLIEQEDITGENLSQELLNAIQIYEADSNIDIELTLPDISPDQGAFEQFDQSINTISRNRMVLRREDSEGNVRLFTAISIFELNRRGGRPENPPVSSESDDNEENVPTPPVFLLFSVPYESLQIVIAQRWGTLIALFLLVEIVTIIASLWVAQSIIHPLYILRDTAVQLAKGDFSHRIKNITKDEIGEVSLAFNEMATQVESMLDEQRAFASNTSHELRTPLTTIRLRSEALRYEQLDNETQALYIEEIDNEVIRLSSLIEDLTLLSKLDANRAELGNAQIDMDRFAEGLLERFTEVANEKNIDLILEKQDALPLFVASINHLTIIFRNILDNALKYTPEDGAISWKLTYDGTSIVSTIVDTGQGIANENLERIFLRFYREDASRSRSIQGTGLGLTLVKLIVQAYSGEISVYSAGIDNGTSVTIKLPVD